MFRRAFLVATAVPVRQAASSKSMVEEHTGADKLVLGAKEEMARLKAMLDEYRMKEKQVANSAEYMRCNMASLNLP